MPKLRYTREILEAAVRDSRSIWVASSSARSVGSARIGTKRLVLQVDHINGLHHDYRPENLRFLCPNCHSQTVNFAVRNHAYAEVVERQTRTA